MRLLLPLLLLLSTLSAAPRYVLIVSYAESDTSFNLTTKGEERALAYPFYFTETLAPTYGAPDVIFGARQTDGGTRIIATATPTSDLLGEQIHLGFPRDNPQLLANFILNNTDYDGKTVLIVWDLFFIPSLVVAFGYTPPLLTGRFDLTYVLSFPFTPPKFVVSLPQALLFGDLP